MPPGYITKIEVEEKYVLSSLWQNRGGSCMNPRPKTAQTDRNHVWQTLGLAVCGNPICALPQGLPFSDRFLGNRHLLAMNPDARRPPHI